ncbi:MAG: hypothetical protein H8E15_14455 [Planctomycetes bacterium]|nr:hypothetical protein [Planctomycetota bacterium]
MKLPWTLSTIWIVFTIDWWVPYRASFLMEFTFESFLWNSVLVLVNLLLALYLVCAGLDPKFTRKSFVAHVAIPFCVGAVLCLPQEISFRSLVADRDYQETFEYRSAPFESVKMAYDNELGYYAVP